MNHAAIVARLRAYDPGAILDEREFRGQLSVTVRPESILGVMQFLRDDAELGYQFLENLCAVDYLGRGPRFEVVYHLLSFTRRHRLCIKVGLPEQSPAVDSLTGIWPTANYQEREAYDLFGITFVGHPSLERIMMPDDWQGHPLRKDVPLGGEEVAFTFNQARIDARKPYARD
jgi:NADH-quinone oxidoreductase subunit C